MSFLPKHHRTKGKKRLLKVPTAEEVGGKKKKKAFKPGTLNLIRRKKPNRAIQAIKKRR